MTTFAEMETLVVEQTRRPELTAVTQAAIRTATLRAHHIDFFPRDLVEGPLSYTIDTTAVSYDLPNISQTLVGLRTIKTIKSLDSITSRPTEQLEFRETDDLYDKDGNRRLSMYTLIGDTLRVFPQSVTGVMSAFYYRNPTVAAAQYASWIADTYPDELASWAAAIVFARTGFAEMAQQIQEQQVKPFKELLLAGHLLGNVS